MKVKSLIFSLISILIFSVCSYAQTQPQNEPKQIKPTQTAQPQAPAPQPQAQPVPQAKTAEQKPAPPCECLKPGIDAIQKAYASVEEDEWPSAIKICKEAITTLTILSKTCKCPEVTVYQKTAEAYLKYAEGGNHLDGADEPNCPFALKLYDEALKLLKESVPKITNADVKTNAKNIQEYAEEEEQFVKDECAESTQGAKPPQPVQTVPGQAKQ